MHDIWLLFENVLHFVVLIELWVWSQIWAWLYEYDEWLLILLIHFILIWHRNGSIIWYGSRLCCAALLITLYQSQQKSVEGFLRWELYCCGIFFRSPISYSPTQTHCTILWIIYSLVVTVGQKWCLAQTKLWVYREFMALVLHQRTRETWNLSLMNF